MARKDIPTGLGSETRNAINDNFIELYNQYIGNGATADEAKTLATQAVANALTANQTSDEAKEIAERVAIELGQAILAGDSSPLGGQLSVGADGTVYSDPQQRFVKELNSVNQDLAQIVNEIVTGEPGKKVKLVAFILRNAGNGWEFVSDTQHEPLNGATVSANSSGITVDFSVIGKKVVSFMAVPDETLQAAGFLMGASVQIKKAIISMSKIVNPAVAYITNPNGEMTLNKAYSNGVDNIAWEAEQRRLRITYKEPVSFGTTIETRSNSKYKAKGTSFDKTWSVVEFYTDVSAEGYIYYDGTKWVINSGVKITGVTYNSVDGILQISHEPTSGNIVNATMKDSHYTCSVYSTSDTWTHIKFYNNGQPVVPPDTNMKVLFSKKPNESKVTPNEGVDLWVTRSGGLISNINPETVVYPQGNIWCLGLLEI